MKKQYLFSAILFFIVSTAAFALDIPIGVQKIFAYQQELALSITFLIAFFGGILTFTSPCGFVVLPTFFSYVFNERKRAFFMTAVFSVGMTFAFVLFGIIAGFAGNFFNDYKVFFASLSGIILAVFGVMLIFNKGFSFFDFRIKHNPCHSWNVFWLGFFFSVGWTPCVGPILGSIVILSAGVGSIFKAALLFASYSLGVAIPLMIVSYFSDVYDLSKIFTSKHVILKFGKKKVYTHLYGIISGIILVLLGAIMFFYNGTSLFMNDIPQYLPWTMNFFTYANEELVSSKIFTGGIADIAGILILLSVSIVIFKTIKNHNL